VTEVPDPERSQELLQRAQHGDRDAFDALLRRSLDRLARLVHARIGAELRQHEESADIVQSALREAVAALPGFEWRGEGSFLRWLGTIVEHKLRHRARDRQRHKRGAGVARAPEAALGRLAASDPSPSRAATAHEAEQRYQAALATLAEPDRELLLLHVDLGCGPTEIAAALGLRSADAVRKRLSRALARLAPRLMPERR
jgi:RNA polymerase sigma-70 factor (ECF subfamily)